MKSLEKVYVTRKAFTNLFKVEFVTKAKYITWLSNIVVVKKFDNNLWMCIDYSDLNKACPKDVYLLPNIFKLVDTSYRFKQLSFTDAYFAYNHILMDPLE